MYVITNPLRIDTSRPFVYNIRIKSPSGMDYRYVGRASNKERLTKDYQRNLERIFSGQPKRPLYKRNGDRQDDHNLRYRYVHLVLAVAVKNGWEIEHYPLENVNQSQLNSAESRYREKLAANLNGGPTWYVEQFDELSVQVGP